MFRTVPLSIIRSFSLHTQQWHMSYRFADSLRAGSGRPSWSCSQAVSKHVWHIRLLCVQRKTPDDGQSNCPKHVEFYSKNKFEKFVHLVGFIIRIYHDARSPERQNINAFSYSVVLQLHLWHDFHNIIKIKQIIYNFRVHSPPPKKWKTLGVHLDTLPVSELTLFSPLLSPSLSFRPGQRPPQINRGSYQDARHVVNFIILGAAVTHVLFHATMLMTLQLR